MKKTFFLLLLLTLTNCIIHTYENRYIEITNVSEKEVYAYFLKDEMSLKIYHVEHPDFYLIEKEKDSFDFAFLNIEKPMWEKYLEDSKDKKLRIIIIEKDSVDKYGWEKIFQKNIYNKKYTLSIEELEAIHWQITYPKEISELGRKATIW